MKGNFGSQWELGKGDIRRVIGGTKVVLELKKYSNLEVMFYRHIAPRTHISTRLLDPNSTHNSHIPAVHRLREPEEGHIPCSWSYRWLEVAPLGAGIRTLVLGKHSKYS